MIIIESIDHVSIPVSDVEKSIDFYREVLGFDLVEHANGSPEAYLQVGDIKVRLAKEDSSAAKSKNGYVAFYVDDDDFEDAIDEIEENELVVVSGPESIKSGKRVVISDPDGNHIAFCSSSR